MVLRVLLSMLGFSALAVSVGFSALSFLAVVIWRARFARRRSNPDALQPPVTVLKPLCGVEPGLHAHLRSFCRQQYPTFQIVFGLRDAADPALAVVERIIAEFPSVVIDVVVDPQLHGDNYKASNLINMMRRARHDVLVIADSDAVVGTDYLSVITAPLLQPDVGLVTCVYRGVPTETVWSRLGAMYINEWYMPSVLMAWLFGFQGYASGQTLCLRRDTLDAIGGLAAIADHLADDYRLCELIRAHRLRVVLSPARVLAEHHEPGFASLAHHELRWMRTIRVLRPRSFSMMFLTFTLPVAVVGLALSAAEPAIWAAATVLFWSALAARLGLHFVHRLHGDRSPLADIWLLPARDLLLCWVWYRAFFAARVRWRGQEFDVDTDGVVRREI
jgi:ceramide glucosyltransferase